ncbi:MAG: hypothetical protein ACI9X0_000381 [Kiritimatiellia bacterium]|jgi:hypothetical protein
MRIRAITTFFMTIAVASTVALAADAPINTLTDQEKADGWQLLFNGQNLDNWKASENQGTFTVKEGILIVHGKRSHLFYAGDVNNSDFINFHLSMDVLTKPKANSGLYFHTAYQQNGWPAAGYEFQVNNTHSDPKKTAGLYGIKDNFTAPVEDDVWFNYEIILKGKDMQSKIDGKTITTYAEPADKTNDGRPGRYLSHGTFAIQGHDPHSVVHFRNIKVKVLP